MKNIYPEKRSSKRYPYHEEVMINGKIPVEPIDIGLGGLYVLSDRSFILGGEFMISIPFREGMIEVKVRIEHKQEKVGMGLMFIDVDDELAGKIKELVEEVERGIDAIKARDCRVLLIDDDAVMRKAFRCRLLLEGFEMFESADGFEAKELISKQQIDMIALNIGSKEKDKLNILGMFKRSMDHKGIPVLAYSINDTEESGDRALSKGADAFVSFSIMSVTRLIKSVKNLFAGSMA